MGDELRFFAAGSQSLWFLGDYRNDDNYTSESYGLLQAEKMALELYDTLSHKKKLFQPLNARRVNFFVCGPTVYDYSHIGHGRTYIAFDAFVKYLRHQGYEVYYAQNITDVDDKIIARAKAFKQEPEELARNFETEYYADMERLGVDSVDKYARATDYIWQIILQIERLMDKGCGYLIAGDGVYYDILQFKDYGKLSGRTAQGAQDAVSRIDESINKRNKGDFALWKFSKPDEPKWPSPWGDGRPGWHIEDTAITETELGEQYDIHGGAHDLIFPHHESEIAQMEAISGKEPLVNYWMHTGFLTVNSEKMSKSLGNFIIIHDFLRKYSKETFRLFILSSHYRSPIDYSESAVRQAAVNTEKLGEFYRKLAKFSDLSEAPTTLRAGEMEATFYRELDDDFNTPKALAALFELVRESNARIAENKLSAEDAAQTLRFLNIVNKIFGIIPQMPSDKIPQEILDFANQREELRKAQKWEKADKIRAKLEKLGYIVDDTPDGPEVKKSSVR